MGKRNKKTQKKRKDNKIAMGMEFYWDRIGELAVKHVGRGDQLKGTVHEMAYCVKRNFESFVRLSGEQCRLTASKNAKVVDVVIQQGTKITERIQLKDVISKSGVRKVIHRSNSGYYRSAKIVATRESTEKLVRNSRKAVSSSGISSKTTTRVADNHGAGVRDKTLMKSNIQDIGTQAGYAAALTAVVSAACELKDAYGSYKKGKISGKQYTSRVIQSGSKNAAKAAVKTASALAIKEGVKQAAKATGKTAMKRVAGSNAVTAVAFGIVEQMGDTILYASGKIDKRTYHKNTLENAGSTGGAVAGAATGAAIGSVVPVVGTAVGAMVGGMIGSIGGGMGLKRLVG